MDTVDDLLPLQPATFYILLALGDEDRHGYAIIQDVEARTNGALRLSAGTLYRSIQRMLEQGLIDDSATQTVQPSTRGLTLRMKKSPFFLRTPAALEGVLALPGAAFTIKGPLGQ